MVIVIGSGPAGIATSACLTHLSIPNIVIEKEDCSAPVWRKKAYDRLHLHVAKEFCQLPHMAFPDEFPKYVNKKLFVQYLDDYMAHFGINPLCDRPVESASFDIGTKTWHVKVKNNTSNDYEEYSDKFLVVASGGNDVPFVPNVQGLDTFTGKILHSSDYKNGKIYSDKNALVVGSGNSGMEIALDLTNYGAKASVVIRSPIHALSKEVVDIGMQMMKRRVPREFVDWFLVTSSRLVYGDLTKYGIHTPNDGPVYRRDELAKFPFIDAGTISKIKSGEIQVLPSITSINGNYVEFANGSSHVFDVIVFGTGFKRSTNEWLMEHDLLNEDGVPRLSHPNHWKGKNGLYCAGLSRRGLIGLAADARNIADDIKQLL